MSFLFALLVALVSATGEITWDAGGHPSAATKCGSPSFTLKWSYSSTGATRLSVATNKTLTINLRVDTTGSNKQVAVLGTVDYPAKQFTINWPTSSVGFPAEWLSSGDLANSGATKSMTIEIEATGVEATSYCGTFCNDPAFSLSCCPLNKVDCPCTTSCAGTLSCVNKKCIVPVACPSGSSGCPCNGDGTCNIGFMCDKTASKCVAAPTKDGKGINMVAYPSAATKCGAAPFTLTWTYDTNAVTYFTQTAAGNVEKQKIDVVLKVDGVTSNPQIAVIGTVSYPAQSFVVNWPTAADGFPYAWTDYFKLGDDAFDNYGTSKDVLIELVARGDKTISSACAGLTCTDDDFPLSCCPTGGEKCACTSSCQPGLVCTAAMTCAFNANCPTSTEGCKCGDKGLCNGGLQCNQKGYCETASTKKGNGISLTAFPRGDFLCGDAPFTLKWTYDNVAHFDGKSDADLDVEILLERDSFGQNEVVATLGVVRYPTKEFVIEFPKPLPALWTSGANPNRITNDDTSYTLTVEVRAVTAPTAVTSYGGAFSTDPDFTLSCCPAGSVYCDCMTGNACNIGLKCATGKCAIDEGCRGKVNCLCTDGDDGVGGTCDKPLKCSAGGVCQSGLDGTSCSLSTPTALSVCATQSSPILGCKDNVCSPCAAGSLDCVCNTSNNSTCDSNASVVAPNVVKCVSGRCMSVDATAQVGCLNCACGDADVCDIGLKCAGGVCYTDTGVTCAAGQALGCVCDAAGACAAPLQCSAGVCVETQTAVTLTKRTPAPTFTTTKPAGCSGCPTSPDVTCPTGQSSVFSAPDKCGCMTKMCVGTLTSAPMTAAAGRNVAATLAAVAALLAIQ